LSLDTLLKARLHIGQVAGLCRDPPVSFDPAADRLERAGAARRLSAKVF